MDLNSAIREKRNWIILSNLTWINFFFNIFLRKKTKSFWLHDDFSSLSKLSSRWVHPHDSTLNWASIGSDEAQELFLIPFWRSWHSSYFWKQLFETLPCYTSYLVANSYRNILQHLQTMQQPKNWKSFSLCLFALVSSSGSTLCINAEKNRKIF